MKGDGSPYTEEAGALVREFDRGDVDEVECFPLYDFSDCFGHNDKGNSY